MPAGATTWKSEPYYRKRNGARWLWCFAVSDNANAYLLIFNPDDLTWQLESVVGRLTMKRLFLHLDINSYFASVEQQANPFCGRPVAVVAQLKSYGAIIASSKKRRSWALKWDCAPRSNGVDPHCAIVEVDPPKYCSTTERLFAILAEYFEEIEPYSIDEAFVEFTGHVKTVTCRWKNRAHASTAHAR